MPIRTGTSHVDVIIIGAGPAGSMAAYELARCGVEVLVLEEHLEVGRPNHCAGLISPRTLELAGLTTEDAALAAYDKARVWGPLGSVAWLESPRTQAVAIDRPGLDRHLAARAENAGARYRLGVRAEGFERSKPGVSVFAANGKGPETFQAEVVVGADGVHSRVARWVQGRVRREVVPAFNASIRFHGKGTQDIEVMVGQDLAPGWFGWVIPLGDGQARIGMGGMCRDVKARYQTFLELIRSRIGPFDLLGQRS